MDTETQAQSEEKFDEYKDLLGRVTNKIDRWHESISKKKKGKFKRDSDFFHIQGSPNKFHSRWSTSSDCDSDNDSSISTPCGSPKLKSNFEKLEADYLHETSVNKASESSYRSINKTVNIRTTGNDKYTNHPSSENRIRILKKKSKNSFKFKLKRNSTVLDKAVKSKPNSPDIKKRKSFRKYLKGSPDLKHSSRIRKGLEDNDENTGDGLLSLHPMFTESEHAAIQSHKWSGLISNDEPSINEIKLKITPMDPIYPRKGVYSREKRSIK